MTVNFPSYVSILRLQFEFVQSGLCAKRKMGFIHPYVFDKRNRLGQKYLNCRLRGWHFITWIYWACNDFVVYVSPYVFV